ncbi:MAG: UTP--glucose-1-phosphate uridylyltransferase [Chloroflexi bacterium RBG_16_50_9]|nr:MAG: UTP--glucose-1-phosphate uridylyltransferase [Chloroflexi bacterium RBG_16_50_9]
MKIRKAVITAAGWGTRFLPATKSQPKEMLPLVNKPLIQYSVEEAVSCGAELVVIVTALGKRAIEDYFDRSFELEQVLEQKGETKLAEEIRSLSSMVDITYVRQKEQLGLGHALLSTRRIIGDEPFLLLLPDDLFEQQELVLKNMMEIYQWYQASVIAVKQVAEGEISRYGIIEPNRISSRIYKVADMVEKPQLADAPSDLAIMGRYVLTPEIYQILEDIPPGRNGEFQLTDGLKRLARQYSIYAYEFEGERYDAGTPLGWLQTSIALGLRNPSIGPGLRRYLDNLVQPFTYLEESIRLEALKPLADSR